MPYNGETKEQAIARVTAYRKAHPEMVRKQRRRHNAKRIAKVAAIIQDLKDTSCIDCGIKYPPYVMQFDHCRGTKLFDVSSARNCSVNKLLDEVAKCDVVCANCHCERTHKRRQDAQESDNAQDY